MVNKEKELKEHSTDSRDVKWLTGYEVYYGALDMKPKHNLNDLEEEEQ